MKSLLITTLRNKSTPREQFRRAAKELATLLAIEAADLFEMEEKSVATPLATTQGYFRKRECLLVPILRSGLVMLSPFLDLYPAAKVGFIGAKRDEKTAIAKLYYSNIPPIEKDAPIFLLDPMIATGGSASLAVDLLKEAGADEKNITLISFIAAPEGVAAFLSHCKKAQCRVAQVDEKLTPDKWILPGLGDFGDRYFGTESE